MKKLRIFLPFLTLLSFFFLAGCGDEGNGGGDSDTIQPKISQNALLLDEETANSIETIDTESKQITLNTKTAQASDIKTGSIVVIPITDLTPDGMLIKVVSVSESDGKIVIQYEKATLTELIEYGDITIPQTELTVDDIDVIEVEDESSSIEVQRPTDGLSAQSNQLNFSIKGSYSRSITVRASVNMNMGYSFRIKIRSFSLNYLRATVNASESASVVAIAQAGAKAKFKKRIGHIKFKPITIWVGWVPVYVRPVVYFYLGGRADTKVAARTSVSQSLSYEAGIQYDGAWSPVSDLQKSFNFDPPSLTKGSLTVRGYVQPKLVLWIYGTAGPYTGVDGYLLLKANALTDPWCELLGGIKGFTGAKVTIFSRNLANVRLDLFDLSTTLYQCQDPYLIVSPEGTLYSRGPEGGSFSPDSITFTLSSSADSASVDYEVTTDVNWLDISNSQGTASQTNPQSVTVAVNQNANSFKEGVYKGKVYFTNLTNANDPPQAREVTLVVRKQSFTVLPDNDAPLLGSDYEGGSFSNTGQMDYQVGVDIGSVDWEITQSPAWVNLSTISGTVSENSSQTVTVSVNTTEAGTLPVGTHKGKIVFVARDKDGNVIKEEARTVYLQVKMKVTPTKGQWFDFPEGGPDSGQSTPWIYSVQALNGDVSFEAYLTQDWLNINNSGTSVADTAPQGGQKDLSIYKEPSKLQTLDKGAYTAELRIENTNSGPFIDEVVIPFTVNIVDPFSVSPAQLSFSGVVGGGVSPSSAVFTVSSDFDNIEVQVSSDQSWVMVNPSSVVVSKNSPQDVTVSIGDVSSLPEGTYTANVIFTKTNASKQIQVTKTVVLTIEKQQPAKIIWLGTLAQNPDSLMQSGISPDTVATAMTPDARVVVGYGINDNGVRRAFRWEDGVMQDLGTLQGGEWSEAYGVSADGSVVVGVSQATTPTGDFVYSHAFRWVNGNMEDLGDLIDGRIGWSIAMDVSADGSVVVGVSEQTYDGGTTWRGFVWVNGTMQDVGILCGSEGNRSEAYAVSDNGSIVVGYAGCNGRPKAFKWESGNIQDLNIGDRSWARGISPDGSVIVGSFENPGFGGEHAFVWKDGTWEEISTYRSEALGVSRNGNVVVGWLYDGTDITKAFIWTPENGFQNMNELYRDLLGECQVGSEVVQDVLVEAVDVSPDGRYILGTGLRCGYRQPFIIDRGTSF